MYRFLMTIVGLLAFLLGVLLIAMPKIYLSLYLPVYSPDFAFAAQRLAPAIMGLGAVMWIARNLDPSPFAARFCAIAALVWVGVAGTGIYHFLSGVANSNILVAAATEVVLAALFAIAARQMRNA